MPGAVNDGLLAGSYVTYPAAAETSFAAPKAPKALGELTWYSVLATPEPVSVAVSVRPTGPVYVPPGPGEAGVSAAVVIGGVVSAPVGQLSGVTRKEGTPATAGPPWGGYVPPAGQLSWAIRPMREPVASR